MTPLADAIQAVRNLAREASPTFDDTQPFQAPAFKSLLSLCQMADSAQRNQALGALTPDISGVADDFQAGRLAMLCGVLVEWGADPSIAIGAILERLAAQIKAAIDGEERDARGLHFMIIPAMTMLCLDVKARIEARRNTGLVNAVRAMAPRHREVNFLHRLLNFVDGEELLVLHPQENKGFRVRLEAIATNYHLFSLLQGVLIGDGKLSGPRPNRKVIATATGAMPHDRIITDAAVWHYANWTALQPDGTLTATPVDTSILGEATLRDIPLFEGERVVLLGPPMPGARGWDSTFFTNLHDTLRSKVEIVEILSSDEVAIRLQRICKATRDSS